MTATHHILIACADEPEAHRKKAGDIIDIRPVSEVEKRGGWGKNEIKRFLILPAKNLSDDIDQLKAAAYSDGSVGELIAELNPTDWTANADIKEGQILRINGWGYQAQAAGTSGAIAPAPAQKYAESVTINGVIYKCLGRFGALKTRKRRFQLELSNLKTGWKPDLDTGKINDKNTAYQPFVDEGIIIDFAEPVGIIKDKIKNSYKYASKKVKA